MHVHISFASGADGDGFGEAGWWAMAGILDHLPALTAITAPTPMSFERFRPHYWAGAYVGWGLANKEMPLRVVSAPSVAPRDVEYKALDATANPYLAFGAILAAACDGVARRADLPAEVSGDPGLLTPEQRAVAGIVPLPATLSEALDELATDSVLREAWGDELHQTYQAFKRYEADALSKLDFDDRRQPDASSATEAGGDALPLPAGEYRRIQLHRNRAGHPHGFVAMSNGSRLVGAVDEFEHCHGRLDGIDQPVAGHRGRRVQLAFAALVGPSSAW